MVTFCFDINCDNIIYVGLYTFNLTPVDFFLNMKFIVQLNLYWDSWVHFRLQSWSIRISRLFWACFMCYFCLNVRICIALPVIGPEINVLSTNTFCRNFTKKVRWKIYDFYLISKKKYINSCGKGITPRDWNSSSQFLGQYVTTLSPFLYMFIAINADCCHEYT